MSRKHIRKETYPVEFILKLMKTSNDPSVILDRDNVRITGVRLRSFLKHGTDCCVCGVNGAFFAKEKNFRDVRYHLNLYAIDDNGKEVLMTRDHIIPRCRGGSEGINNMQTMCINCNNKKGSKIC